MRILNMPLYKFYPKQYYHQWIHLTILHNLTDPCPDGYRYKDGEIVNASIQGGIKATIEECALKCSKNPQCNSFEQANGQCNLNKESKPIRTKYQKFVFCSKEGNG